MNKNIIIKIILFKKKIKFNNKKNKIFYLNFLQIKIIKKSNTNQICTVLAPTKAPLQIDYHLHNNLIKVLPKHFFNIPLDSPSKMRMKLLSDKW